jgi:hypothetical protein
VWAPLRLVARENRKARSAAGLLVAGVVVVGRAR